MENFRKVKDMMIETIVGIVGIVVTVVIIIVAAISIIQFRGMHKHQKSNRRHQG